MGIHLARTAIQAGAHDPLAYEILIRRLRESNKQDEAADWLGKALKHWPDQKARFGI